MSLVRAVIQDWDGFMYVNNIMTIRVYRAMVLLILYRNMQLKNHRDTRLMRCCFSLWCLHNVFVCMFTCIFVNECVCLCVCIILFCT